MDGVTLGSPPQWLGHRTTIVFVWPIISGNHPRVALWPIGRHYFGVLITRPVIFGLAVGLMLRRRLHVSITQVRSISAWPVQSVWAAALLFTSGFARPAAGTRAELACMCWSPSASASAHESCSAGARARSPGGRSIRHASGLPDLWIYDAAPVLARLRFTTD